jgi:hypothetical protein
MKLTIDKLLLHLNSTFESATWSVEPETNSLICNAKANDDVGIYFNTSAGDFSFVCDELELRISPEFVALLKSHIP